MPHLYRYGLVARTHNFVNATYAGVPCVQSPLNLSALQEETSQLRPALLIEIGSYEGGSALFYAQLMEALGSGRVLSIDLRRPSGIEHQRIEFIESDSGHRPGPLPANREFLAVHPEFECDAELGDRYGFTTHPLGWLRRRA